MREWATPTSNQSNQLPQPQDRRVMRRTRVRGRKARDRVGEDEGGANKRKKHQKSSRRDVENGGDSGGRRKIRKQESVGSVNVTQDV